MSDDVYEIYAVKYGRHERKSPDNFIGGDTHDVPMPLDYFVWAIVGKDRTFILDTGFDQARADARKRKIIQPVGDGLRALGIDPARSRTSSSRTCITTMPAITTCSRMRATICRTARWPMRPGAACATP